MMSSACAEGLVAVWQARARQLRPFAVAASHQLDLCAAELEQALTVAKVSRAAPCPSCAAETSVGGIAAVDASCTRTQPGQQRLVCPSCELAPAVVLRDRPRGARRVTDSRAHLAALADALPPEAVVPVPVAWLRELLAPIDTNPPEGQGEEPRGPSEDRLLTVAEAAPRLGVTEDWLYRHAKQLPFTVRLGRKTLRFSMLKLERYLATRRQPA